MSLPEESIETDIKDLSDPEPEATPKSEPKTELEPEVEKEEEVPDEPELEDEEKPAEEDEPEEEEKPEDDVPQGRVSFKEIKAKYPEIFKEFPSLRGVIAQENEYSKVFGSVETAKAAVQHLEAFNILGNKMMDGDAKFLLTELGNQSEEAFDKFVGNFLGSVRELKPAAFAKIVTPLVKGILRSAQGSSDKNYKLAGHWLQKFLQLESLDEVKPDPRLQQKENELKQTAYSLEQRQVATFVQDTIGEGKDRLRAMIVRDLDPENVMTDRMKKAATNEILEELDALAGRDEVHMSRMNQLWKAAKDRGLNREARENIVRAYLARVRTALPGIRQKVREDYLGPRGKSDKDTPKPKAKNYIPSSGSQGSGKEKKLDLSKVDKAFFNKHTDEDILNMD